MAGTAAIARANGKKGGRPKGSKSPQTLEREAALAAYRARVCKIADDLLDAELTAAKGCTFLFKRPKNGKVERVTSEALIKQFLDGELPNTDDAFYFISTEKPDTMAIRGIFDRTFDRPAQRVELGGTNGEAVATVIVKHIYEESGKK